MVRGNEPICTNLGQGDRLKEILHWKRSRKKKTAKKAVLKGKSMF